MATERAIALQLAECAESDRAVGLNDWLKLNRSMTSWTERYMDLECDHESFHYVTADGWCLICGEPA
jgi:hypothetical protein